MASVSGFRRLICFLTVIMMTAGGFSSVMAETRLADDALPSRYDMREKGVVTPVKLQYPWGSCWCFGAVAAAETSILSAMGKTYDEYPLDLSELHAAWFVKHGITAADDPAQAGENTIFYDDTDETTKPMGWEQTVTLTNGTASSVSFLFSTGAGPVDESAVPYHGREQTPEAWLVRKDPEKWIRDYMLMNKKAGDEDRSEEDRRAEAAEKLENKLDLLKRIVGNLGAGDRGTLDMSTPQEGHYFPG